jgi:hypothetical protein
MEKQRDALMNFMAKLTGVEPAVRVGGHLAQNIISQLRGTEQPEPLYSGGRMDAAPQLLQDIGGIARLGALGLGGVAGMGAQAPQAVSQTAQVAPQASGLAQEAVKNQSLLGKGEELIRQAKIQEAIMKLLTR